MTAPRPIRPIDGNALLANLPASFFASGGWAFSSNEIRELINAAPTLPPQPEPVAVADVPGDGDAISRSALIVATRALIKDGTGCGYYMAPSEVKRAIEESPALQTAPCAQPEAEAGVDCDVVRAEDVQPGIAWFDGACSHTVEDWHGYGTVFGISGAPFGIHAIVSMLRDARQITWPKGHPRANNEEPPDHVGLLQKVLEEFRNRRKGTPCGDLAEAELMLEIKNTLEGKA